MLLTEEEARKKWCPYAGRNGYGSRTTPESQGCIASDCMMWRFVGEWRTKSAYAPAHITRIAYERGHCGLSGKPES